jgi:hypothetical protein
MLSKKELLKSPRRKWDDDSKEYDVILLVPDGTKHDSGYMHIAVIGGNWKEKKGQHDKMEFEICAFPDDISCHFPLLDMGNFKYPQVRMDCYYPQGVLQYHGHGKFKVGPSLSSVDIYFTPNQK